MAVADEKSLQAEIEKYRAAMGADPKSRAFAPLAEALRKAGKTDEALKTVIEGLKAYPNLPGALVTHGRCLLALGKFAEAKVPLEKAVKLAPENISGWSALGDVHEKLNDVANA